VDPVLQKVVEKMASRLEGRRYRLYLFGSRALGAHTPRSRNLTSHTYEEELAEQVYAALPQALARFEAPLSRLEEEGF
jgi:hypothetical protein